jgi:hypothetical protein
MDSWGSAHHRHGPLTIAHEVEVVAEGFRDDFVSDLFIAPDSQRRLIIEGIKEYK